MQVVVGHNNNSVQKNLKKNVQIQKIRGTAKSRKRSTKINRQKYMIGWKYDNVYPEVQRNIKFNYIEQAGRLDCIIKCKENAYNKTLKIYN
jgi:hypothetical protein